jgi:hypothetical protein
VRRITKAALGGLAGFALVLGGTQAASGSDVVKQLFGDQLTDMLPPLMEGSDAADKAFNGATATLRIMKTPDGTGFKLRVEEIDTSTDPSVVGRHFGSHLHVGPCVDDPDQTDGLYPDETRGHYQDVEGGPVTPDNEVWFDVVPNDNGVATHNTFVSFKPVDRVGLREMSIVIHAGPTGGKRETCLPLDVSGIFPTPPAPTE